MNITFFANRRGRVARIAEATQPLYLTVEGFTGTMNMAITQIGINGKALASFSEGFGDSIYVYVIKEGMGDVQISGVTFPGDCYTGISTPVHGSENVLNYYYHNYGLTSRGKPVKIILNNTVIEGFIVAFATGISDADSGIGSFSLILKTLIPPKPPRNLPLRRHIQVRSLTGG